MSQFKILEVYYAKDDTLIALSDAYRSLSVGDVLQDGNGQTVTVAGLNRPTLAQVNGATTNSIALIKGKVHMSSGGVLTRA